MVPLRVLVIEDDENDAALVLRALAQAGYDVTSTRVDTADELRNALARGPWDLAIADHTMPAFTGTQALAIVREQTVDLPFIFVSGTIGEDVAVAAMKQGAHDYIIKGNLARLAPAVERELRDAAVRRERTRANERVAYLAYHDPLTDLPNRALLNDRMRQALLTSKRDGRPLALLVIDLDGFKEINDALGHQAGDRILQQVAGRLRRTLRESDTVARFGGDEFAVLLPTTSLDGAERTARKILQDLDQPFLLDRRALFVSASIGVASFPVHATTSDELLQRADAAMYAAKANHSGFVVAAGGSDRRTAQRLAMSSAMRKGIIGRQFELEYQPIVDLRTGAITALEALIRWDHPEQGRLMPEDFIRVAEQTGIIMQLTEFSIDRGLADFAHRSHPPLAIAANLSPHTLHSSGLPERIRQVLNVYGADPSSLVLEITENVIMSDQERSTRTLNELHDMGVRIAVDDFGTGYSSLSYLRQLPVDELKIDRSFVIGMASGEDDALVRGIIDLAHSLRLRVVAEGVETEDVCDRLRALGCDAAQGYYIHRPAPLDDVVRWMADRR